MKTYSQLVEAHFGSKMSNVLGDAFKSEKLPYAGGQNWATKSNAKNEVFDTLHTYLTSLGFKKHSSNRDSTIYLTPKAEIEVFHQGKHVGAVHHKTR